MIIDTHMHSGVVIGFDMSEDKVMASMNKYGIDIGIVSNIEATEGDHEPKLLPPNLQKSQEDCLRDNIRFARNNPGRIALAAWVKPATQCVTDELETLIKENRDIIVAMKFHPYHAVLPFDDKKMDAFIQLAEKYSLVVVTHTGGSDNASPQRVYTMAKKYPTVNFVMVHMDLGSDNKEAIRLIGLLPNLYGDTTWVPLESALQLIQEFGSKKLLFGSDAPIDGIDTYDHNPKGEPAVYRRYFNELPKRISPQEYDDVMFKNAIQLFGLKSFIK